MKRIRRNEIEGSANDCMPSKDVAGLKLHTIQVRPIKMRTNAFRTVFLPLLFLLSCNLLNQQPTPTPTPGPAGDLGFGEVSGKVADAATGAPIVGATVTCEHFSYTSNEADRCNRSTTTDQAGNFSFENV